MKNRIFLIAAFVLGIHTLLCAQVSPRMAGLEKNPEYMAFLLKEHNLQIQEDSVSGVVDKIRDAFKTNPEERAKYGTEILRLEGELFDIRNEIGLIESMISNIEQEFVISNLDNYIKPSETTATTKKTPVSTVKSANLVYNGYLKTHLIEKEYATLLSAQNKETAVTNYLKIFSNNYASIQHIEQLYKLVNKAQTADSLYRKYMLLSTLNNKISDSIASIWGSIFDNKSYAYSYLFDKMNENEVLNSFENNAAKVRQQRAALQDQYTSDIVAIYPAAKKLLLDYELKLAEVTGLTEAADSLKATLKNIDTLELKLPKIIIEERTFIDYQDIVVAARSPYSTARPIPQCIIYPRGVVYRIFLGSYTKPQVPTIFKGVSPIGHALDADKRHCYYAGGYATQEEAQVGYDELKKIGFKRPEVVVWKNGDMTNLTSGSATSTSTSTKTNIEALYRIEIKSNVNDLPQIIKQIISDQGEGAETSRLANSTAQEFEYTFIIGTFDSNAKAAKLAEIIAAEDVSLQVSVAKVPN